MVEASENAAAAQSSAPDTEDLPATWITNE